MKNWKIISAALLAASLVTATSGQAWASTKTTDLETVNLQSVLEIEDIPTTLNVDSDLVSSIIVPTGYLANNIFALLTNFEKISNPNAKEALLNNIERAIARWEAKKVEDDTVIESETEEENVSTPPEEDIEDVEDVSEAEESQDEDSDKEEEKTLAEREAKKNAQLAKVEAIKAANSAKKEVREEAKQVKKEAREEAKQVKKEERKSNKQDKQNGNQSSKSENKGNNK
ncbi:hypothetical protein [Paenisporosarcina sp. TG20]|uniref:hypothetical protein n=1 Tax=Paenisporosarcina sp. TG20 TaxID=1211706 RepID=UPI00031D67B3|nr:hypothetical protein [Paenisporosarcina sp. TG20]